MIKEEEKTYRRWRRKRGLGIPTVLVFILLLLGVVPRGRAQGPDPCRIDLESCQDAVARLQTDVARLETALSQSQARERELEGAVGDTRTRVDEGKGILGRILGILRGRIVPRLDLLKTLTRQWKDLVDLRVWPQNFIRSALNRVRAVAAEFRGSVRAITDRSIRAATLRDAIGLEAIVRSSNVLRIPTVRGELEKIFLPLPSDGEAHRDLQKLIDAYDAMAAAAWGEAIKFDAAAERETNVAEAFERSIARAEPNPDGDTAPGTAPILKAAGSATAVRQQAHLQMMIAQLIRIKAMEIASENVRKKRLARNKNDVLQLMKDLLDGAARSSGGGRR